MNISTLMQQLAIEAFVDKALHIRAFSLKFGLIVHTDQSPYNPSFGLFVLGAALHRASTIAVTCRVGIVRLL